MVRSRYVATSRGSFVESRRETEVVAASGALVAIAAVMITEMGPDASLLFVFDW